MAMSDYKLDHACLILEHFESCKAWAKERNHFLETLSAADLGMPVDTLAFPGEEDFFTKLASQKPNRVDVELVRHRK